MVLVLLLDQLSKFYIKTHFSYGEEYEIFNWFMLKFVENPGMAYGVEFGGMFGKLLLSVLRIFLIGGIAWYVWTNLPKHRNNYFQVGMALVLAGAIGNLIDGLFYGMIFDSGLTWNAETGTWQAYSGVAQADFSGYSGFLKGAVVDMLYFPLFRVPESIPLIGGKEFFSYIFNVADSAITVGGAIILFFRKKVFG